MKQISAITSAVIFWAVGLLLLADHLSAQPKHTKIHNPDGWKIPAYSSLHNNLVKKKVTKEMIDDVSVHVILYELQELPIAQRVGKNPLLLAIPNQENEYLYREIEVAAKSARVYSANGKIFAIYFDSLHYFYDPVSKEGGFGPHIQVIYEDRNGDGRFELIHLGAPETYELHLPSWARSQ